MAVTSQYTQLREMIGDMKEAVTEAVNRLDGRLNVHDQKHIHIDEERRETLETVRKHAIRIADVENLARQTALDVNKLTGNINKLAWAIATPLIALVVLAIIGLLQ